MARVPRKSRKPASRPASRATAPRSPRRRPAPAPAPDAGAVERPRLLALAACALAAAALLHGAYRSAQVKVAQHVSAPKQGPTLWQGDKPGNVSRLIALKPLPGGGVASLQNQGAAARLQLFSPRLELKAWADLKVKPELLADMAALKGGGFLLAGRDGTAWPVDAGLKLGRPVATGAARISHLEAMPDGDALALDNESGAYRRLGPDGRPVGQGQSPEAVGAKCMSAFADGGVALLRPRKGGLWVTVLGPGLQVEGEFRLRGLVDWPPTRLAVSGNVILVNDSKSSLGILYYRRDGKPLGNTLGVGKLPIPFPGFVGGDALGDAGYVHYADGLVRIGLDWGGAR